MMGRTQGHAGAQAQTGTADSAAVSPTFARPSPATTRRSSPAVRRPPLVARRPSPAIRRPPSIRPGFILIAALWLLVALGAVGLDAALRSRSRRLAAANLLDETRARAAATAGVEYARSRLTAAMLDRADELRAEALSSARTSRQRSQAERRSVTSLFRQSNPMDDPWRAPEELIQQEMTFVDARYSLRVRDTGAALNLNDATEEMLRNFFAQGMRVDYAHADRLAQAILDWRDEDEIPRLGGAERDQYLDAEAPMLPPNRDFAELEELRYVMGMTPELFEASKQYLTLIGSGDVNLNAAPEPVLLALPHMTPSAVTELMRLRQIGAFPRSSGELRRFLPMLDQSSARQIDRLATFTTNEVEILAEGRVDGSPIRVQARVVVARSNAGAVVVWRRFD